MPKNDCRQLRDCCLMGPGDQDHHAGEVHHQDIIVHPEIILRRRRVRDAPTSHQISFSERRDRITAHESEDLFRKRTFRSVTFGWHRVKPPAGFISGRRFFHFYNPSNFFDSLASFSFFRVSNSATVYIVRTGIFPRMG